MTRLVLVVSLALPLVALVGCGGAVECQQVGDELVCVGLDEQAVTVDEQSDHGGGCPGGGGGGLGKLRLGQIDDLLSDPNAPSAGTLAPPKCDLANSALCPLATRFAVVTPKDPGPTGNPPKQ